MKLFITLVLATGMAMVAALIVLQPNESGTLACAADELVIVRESITRATYSCVAYTPTPEPTVTPTAEPSSETTPYVDAPACATHDPRTYHGLWDAQLGCHHDHHHGDNPHDADDVFGVGYFSFAGGEISYPWQTYNANGLENDLKHEGYVWLVRENLPCPSSPSPGCITDFRAVVHQMADGHDAPVRYHSFALEARVCPNNDLTNCGIARIGGWHDTGDLEVDGVVAIDEPDSGNRVKQHSHSSGGAVWYPSSTVGAGGIQGFARVSVTIYDQWDYTDPLSPGVYTDYVCWPNPRCRNNGTSYLPHLVQVDVPAEYESLVDPDGDLVANYEGYLNRYGAVVDGCAGVSVDCVPFRLENIRTDITYAAEGDAGIARDYDIYFGNRPSGWQRPKED